MLLNSPDARTGVKIFWPARRDNHQPRRSFTPATMYSRAPLDPRPLSARRSSASREAASGTLLRAAAGQAPGWVRGAPRAPPPPLHPPLKDRGPARPPAPYETLRSRSARTTTSVAAARRHRDRWDRACASRGSRGSWRSPRIHVGRPVGGPLLAHAPVHEPRLALLAHVRVGARQAEEVAERSHGGDVVAGQRLGADRGCRPMNCLIIAIHSSSMTSCAGSKVTPDSVIPAP